MAGRKGYNKKGNPGQEIPYTLAINLFFAAQKRMHKGVAPSGFTTQYAIKKAYTCRQRGFNP
jgi:hypothetical protein